MRTAPRLIAPGLGLVAVALIAGGLVLDQIASEHQVPVAEGRTNAAIAKKLWLTERTVETHVRSILSKLGLPLSGDDHRRVLAVLTYLRASTV